MAGKSLERRRYFPFTTARLSSLCGVAKRPALPVVPCAARHQRKYGVGFKSVSAIGFARQPSLTGTLYSRPGANRAQKCRSPGTNARMTGIFSSGRVWSYSSTRKPLRSTSRTHARNSLLGLAPVASVWGFGSFRLESNRDDRRDGPNATNSTRRADCRRLAVSRDACRNRECAPSFQPALSRPRSPDSDSHPNRARCERHRNRTKRPRKRGC